MLCVTKYLWRLLTSPCCQSHRYENTEKRAKRVAEEKGLMYMGMGVSGGEEGARNGARAFPCGQERSPHLHLVHLGNSLQGTCVHQVAQAAWYRTCMARTAHVPASRLARCIAHILKE